MTEELKTRILAQTENPPHNYRPSKRLKNVIQEKFGDLKMDWSIGHSPWIAIGFRDLEDARDAQLFISAYSVKVDAEDKLGWCVYTTIDAKTNTLYARKEALPKFQVFERFDEPRQIPTAEFEPPHPLKAKIIHHAEPGEKDDADVFVDTLLDTTTGTIEKVDKQLRQLDRRIDNLTLEFLSLKELLDDKR